MPILVENGFLYTLANREFYEPIERYSPDESEFVKPTRRRLPSSWRAERRGIWFHCAPPNAELPPQGWKIHVSAIAPHASSILASVSVILVQREVPFKFALDRRCFRLLNSKNWSRGGAGKFITIYPRSIEEFRDLLATLYPALAGYSGPYILSDRRYRDSQVLYYRYGGFHLAKRLNVTGGLTPVLQAPDGTFVDDQRSPYFRLPEGVIDPLLGEGVAVDQESKEVSLADGRYEIESAITFSNTGGVYLGQDRETDQKVIIKEARPCTASTFRGTDAVWTLRKEHRLLSLLEGEKIAPRVVDFFHEWEHFFLVEEYIEGVVLRGFNAHWTLALRVQPTVEDAEVFLRRYQSLYLRIAKALKTLHDRGIVFSDLSHYNVIVVDDGADIRLIDFEASYELGVEDPTLLHTPGFAPTTKIQAGIRALEDDWYAFGGLMLAGLMPINGLLALEPNAFRPFLRSFVHDLSFPSELSECVSGLLTAESSERIAVSDVIERLEVVYEIDPPEITTVEADDEDLPSLTRSLIEYIEQVATPERQDRLFPSAPSLFQTNPLSLAYGACGVACALKKIQGEVSDSVLEWIQGQPISVNEYPPGLYVGLSGISWALLDLGLRERAEEILAMTFDHPLLRESTDIFHGLAGWGLAQLRFFLETGDELYLDKAREAGRWLLKTRERVDDRCYWLEEDQEYCGLGHGAAGIALFLLYLAIIAGDEEYIDVGRGALRHVLERGIPTSDGGVTWRAREGHPTVTPYWRWGTAGIGMVFLRYGVATGDDEFHAPLRDILIDTDRKYSIFPGQHLGLAGIGEFHLDLRHFGVEAEKGAFAARKVLSGVLHFRLDREEGVSFPGETRERISCDLGTGSAGIALFINRLLYGGTQAFMLDEVLEEYLRSEPKGQRIYHSESRYMAGVKS